MKKINLILIGILFLSSIFILLGPKVLAATGGGTATIAKDGGALGAGVTVEISTSHIFTVVLTINTSGMTLGAASPTFTIPTGFTAPNPNPVATAVDVNADGKWSVVSGTGSCVVDSAPGSLTTTATGQVITVDITADCAVGDTITLTYKGTSSITMGATALTVSTADAGDPGPVTPLIAGSPTITVTAAPILPGTLHIVKHVINDSGGSTLAPAFTINVTGTNVSSSSFAGSEAGTDITLDAGAYTVDETSVSGYTKSLGANCSGTIVAGETKNCTITNNDIAPRLIVNKVVINNDTGNKVIADFPLFVDGVGVTSGVENILLPGAHTVSETPNSNYTGTIAGNCAADGTVSLLLGEIKTCTITNDDITPAPLGGSGESFTAFSVPPLIDIVKVPNPLALPNGPGPVVYTYTLRNIGTVPVINVKLIGDTCAPIVLAYGDNNSDAKLDLNEKWVYTCKTNLSETHTNIVTATGWNDGTNATDIASATVIVGVSVVPPLIHVTKIPNLMTLPVGGGKIVYINEVTNPGTVALTNINLVDDKCSPVAYVSGDVNNDSKLDPTETWTYACEASIDKTTTNTVMAEGEANGLKAKDFAIATVVVAVIVPKLPKTGVVSDGNILWAILIIIVIVSIFFYFIQRKRSKRF